jgi:hypothetical protein
MLSELIEKKIIKSESRREYIGASSIGNPCSRALWYDFHGYDKIPFEQKTLRTFEVGKNLESLVIEWLDDCNLIIERPHADNDYLKLVDKENSSFQGHMDALLHLDKKTYVIEIKTARNASFNVFKKLGVKLWYERYYAQLQAYMGISGHHQSYLIALNKDTSELHDELVLFDEIYFATLQLKAIMTKNKDLIPKKINESPLFYLCKMCEFREVCHK